MNPEVSVVLCGYNQAEFVKDAVESVLSQTLKSVELIAVDNGSTDGSADILERWRGDPRVKLLLHGENGPVTKRLNEAVRAASGRFVAFLYADDYYLPELLEKQVRRFDSLDATYGVVYSPGWRLNVQTGAKWRDASFDASGDVLEKLITGFSSSPVNPISPLIRKACLERHPFHEDIRIEGEYLFLRLAMTSKFSYLDEPLVVMREHLHNAGKAIKKNVANILALLEKLEQEPDFPSRLRPVLVESRGRFLRNCCWLAIRMAEDPAWARQCFREAVRWTPSQALHPRMLAGGCLSLLPASALRGFNRAMNALRPSPQNSVFREDYK